MTNSPDTRGPSSRTAPEAIANDEAVKAALRKLWLPDTPLLRLSLIESLPIIPHLISLDEAKRCVNDANYTPTGVPNPYLVLFTPQELGQRLHNNSFPTLAEVKSRYKVLTQLFHPDTNLNSGATEVFQYITSAYQQLKTDQGTTKTVERMKQWNELLAAARTTQPEIIPTHTYEPGTGNPLRSTADRSTARSRSPQPTMERAATQPPPQQHRWYVSFKVGDIEYEFPFAGASEDGESRPMSAEREAALKFYFYFGKFGPLAEVLRKELEAQARTFGLRHNEMVEEFRNKRIFPGELEPTQNPSPADNLVRENPSVKTASPPNRPVFGGTGSRNTYNAPAPQIPLSEKIEPYVTPFINPLMRLGQLIENVLTASRNKPTRSPAEQQPPVAQRPKHDLPPGFHEVAGKKY